MSEKLVVRSAVREMLKGKYQVSEEFLDALDKEVKTLIERAAKRAEENGRSTLKARDV
ncbi:MAG: DUF1931 domain-containing protein [Candidatus Aenigmarchaeota archaeon]|nr:DUF1931 domain-containing protein [Candidatus Aenigmarchaeota archaeon]